MVLAVGCGGTTVAPSTASTATPTASASSGAAGTSPSPSAAPSADPGIAALRAFITFATKAGMTYQGTFTGESRQTITVVKITKGVLQGHGADALVRATFTVPDKRGGVVEHRYVAGAAWFRLAAQPWQRLKSFTARDSMGAFASVHSLADVAYIGPVKSGGKTLYRLQIQSQIVNPVMLPEINLSDAATTSSKLTLLIDANGRPVSGTNEIRGRGRVSGQLQELVIDLDVTFTKIGAPVTIKAP